MTIFFDSNSGATVRANGTAYIVGDKVNSTSTTKPFTFECTVAGTSGGSEPTWPTVAGGTVSDGTVTWTARTPDTWQFALLTAQRAIITQGLLLDNSVKIFGEKNHSESGSSLTMLASTYIYDEIPGIYRVDKTTGEYSPAKSDGSTNANFTATGSGDIIINPYSHWFGFKFVAGYSFTPKLHTVNFDDCVIEMGETFSAGRLYFSNPIQTTFTNCYLKANYNASSIRFISDAKVSFKRCILDFTSTSGGLIQGINDNFDFQIVEFDDCDLSGVADPLLVDTSDFGSGVITGAHDNRSRVVFRSCILPDDFDLWDGQWFAMLGTYIQVENCSSNGSATYKQAYRDMAGGRAANDVVFRNGGFFTPFGVRLSEELTPGIYANRTISLKSSNIGIYLETSGAKILEIEMLENFTTPLDNSQVWVELHYYKGVSDAFHTIDTSTKRFAALSYTTLPEGEGLDGWTGEAAGYRSIKVQIPVTVARAGLAYAVVRVGNYESGKSVIIDPLITEL